MSKGRFARATHCLLLLLLLLLFPTIMGNGDKSGKRWTYLDLQVEMSLSG